SLYMKAFADACVEGHGKAAESMVANKDEFVEETDVVDVGSQQRAKGGVKDKAARDDAEQRGAPTVKVKSKPAAEEQTAPEAQEQAAPEAQENAPAKPKAKAKAAPKAKTSPNTDQTGEEAQADSKE